VRLPTQAHAGPGRPKLGVVAREVSLLPRTGSGLANNRTGLGGTARLVDQAGNMNLASNERAWPIEAAGRFLSAMQATCPATKRQLAPFSPWTANLDELIRDCHGTSAARSTHGPRLF